MSKFLNYLNPFTQSNKIYSEDDLMSMSINDIVNNKEEIIAQKGIIGIPKQAELSSSRNAVYVNGYTKSDGTVVKPHWRSRSGGGVNSLIQGASGGVLQDGISQTAQNVSGKSAQPQDFVTAALPVQNSQNLNVPDTFSLEQNSQTQSAPINANGIDGSTWNVLENTTPDFGNTNTYQTIPNEPDYSNMSEEDIILNTAKVVQHSLLNNPYAKSRFSEREWNAIENLINCDGRLDVWMMKELDPYESRIKCIDEFDSPEVVKDILKYCVKRPTLDEMNKKIDDFIDWSKQFKNKPANTNPQNVSGSVSDMQNISDYSNIQGSPTGFAAPVQNKNSNGQKIINDINNAIQNNNNSLNNDNVQSWEPSEMILYGSAFENNIQGIQKNDGTNQKIVENILKNIYDNMPQLAKSIVDFLKNELDKFLAYSTFSTTDYSVPKTKYEELNEKLLTKALKNIFPLSSDSVRDGLYDMKAARENPHAVVYNSIADLKDRELFNKFLSLDIPMSEKGVEYDYNSKESQNISNSKTVEILAEQYRNGDVRNGDVIEFPALCKNDFLGSIDRHCYIQHVTVYNPRIKDGVFTCKLLDNSDFSKRNIRIGIHTLVDMENNFGDNMQIKGIYKPYFRIINVRRKL